MPAAVVGVAVWAGASAATATAIGAAVTAIGAAVIKGAIIGAVVGAATSALTGQNILKGAIRGGLIGGITAGLAKGFSLAFSGAGATAGSAAPTVGELAGTSELASSPSWMSDSLMEGTSTVGSMAQATPSAVGGVTSITTEPISSGITQATPEVVAQTATSSTGSSVVGTGLVRAIKAAGAVFEKIPEKAMIAGGSVLQGAMEGRGAEKAAKEAARIEQDRMDRLLVTDVGDVNTPQISFTSAPHWQDTPRWMNQFKRTI